MPAIPRPISSTRISVSTEELDADMSQDCNTPPRKATHWYTTMGMAKGGPLSRVPAHVVPGAVLLGLVLLMWLGGVWPFGSRHDPNSLVFISVGDFGAGSTSQKEVAAQMARTARERNAMFFVSLGDNVYDRGVTNDNDLLFWKCFEDVYTHSSLQKQWLMSLGDHDHRGSVQSQIAFSSKSKKWHMPAPYYVTNFAAGSDSSAFSVDIITTDSVGLEGAVAQDVDNFRRFSSDYNMTLVGKKAGKKQLKWLKRTLKDSQANWKIVVGHRPVITSGVRSRYPAETHFAPLMLPILEEFKVDVYMNGHDHVSQHLESKGVTFLGSGVGGYGLHDSVPINSSVWVDSTQMGFMVHTLTKDKMVTDFINSKGQVLHTVEILHNQQPSPTARPLRL